MTTYISEFIFNTEIDADKTVIIVPVIIDYIHGMVQCAVWYKNEPRLREDLDSIPYAEFDLKTGSKSDVLT